MSDPRSERLAFGVSAFGKHPGWGDHIDDIPLPTPELRRVRELFYERGIRRVVDSGIWAELPEGHRLPGFDHVLMWALEGVIVLGRAWRSTDASGRSAYPFVVIAQVPAGRSDEDLFRAGAMLDSLGEACRGVGEADAVKELVGRADGAFVGMLSGVGEGPASREVSWTREVADAMGDQRVGMHRILFQIEREMAAYLPMGGSGSSSTRRADLSPRHIRLPRVQGDAWRDARAWLGMLRERVRADVLVIAPPARGWCDAIVGDCDERTLAPILMTPSATAIASDIAYELDEAFTRHAEDEIARPTMPEQGASLGARLGKQVIERAAGAVRKGAEEIAGSVSPATRQARGPRGRGTRVIPMVIVGVIALLIVVVVIAISMGGGKTKEEGGDDAQGASPNNGIPAPAGSGPLAGVPSDDASRANDAYALEGDPARDPAQDSRPAPERDSGEERDSASAGDAASDEPARPPVAIDETIPAHEAWSAWVLAWDGWAIDLSRRFGEGGLDARLSGDPHLRPGLLEPLSARVASHQFREVELRRSPRRSDSAHALASDMPSEAQGVEAVRRAREVASELRAWRAELAAWPAREPVARAMHAIESLGWRRARESLAAIERVPDLAAATGEDGGVNPVEAWMLRVLDEGDRADALHARAPRLAGMIDGGSDNAGTENAGDAGAGDDAFWLPAAFASHVRALDPAIEESVATCDALIALGERIDHARASLWPHVDRARLAALHPTAVVPPESGADVPVAIGAFLEAIGDARVLRPEGDDPRAGADLALEVDRIGQEGKALRERLDDANAREALDALLARASAVGARLPEHARSPWTRGEEDSIRARQQEFETELATVASGVRALDAELVAEFERILASLGAQDRLSESSGAINAFWADASARSVEMARGRGPGTPIEAWTQTLRSTLARIEGEIPAREGGEVEGLNAPALAREMTSLREARIAGVLASVSWTGEAFEGDLDGALERERSAFDAIAGRVREITRDLDTITSALAQGEGVVSPDKAALDGAIRDLLESGDARPIIERSAPALVERMHLAARIASENDADRLLAHASDADAWTPTRAMAILRVLEGDRDGAPDDAGEPRGLDLDAFERVLRAGDEIAGRFGNDVGDEIRSRVRRTWAAFVERSADAGDLRRAWDMRERAGGTIEDLIGPARFNVLAMEFRSKAEGGDGRAALAAAQTMLEGVATLRADLPAEAGQWLERVEELASRSVSPSVQEFGPGRVGWAGRVEEDGARVVFARAGAEISFRRVPGVSGVYLQEDELSIAALIAGLDGAGVAQVRGSWSALDRAMGGDAGHKGPRGWGVVGGNLTVADQWYSGDGRPQWAPGLVAERPSGAHPVQGISASGARAVAAALGCRLARVTEWRAASGASDGANRLDAAWIEQLRFARQEDPTGQRPEVVRPDRGEFYAMGERAFEPDVDRPASDARDGVVLFAAIGERLGGGFRAMVGNVAEYVEMDEGGVGLIGASAMSGRAVSSRVAIPVADERTDYDDAGIRLAFEASGDLSGGALWREVVAVTPFVSTGR